MAEKKKKRIRWFWEKEPDEDFEQHMHRLWHEMWEPFGFGMRIGFPRIARAFEEIPVNISETDKELIVRAELPGFKKDEIKLTVTEDTFELSAEKKREEVERGETFYRKEAERKSVHRAFTLPVAVDADRVSAKLEEGVLTVIMPKLEVERKKKKVVEID
ncbi:MAG: Hsp20/alpha crystallin family protein [Candidatus Aenigmatarchaeota archaeon]